MKDLFRHRHAANDELLANIAELTRDVNDATAAITLTKATLTGLTQKKKHDQDDLDLALYELQLRIERGEIELTSVSERQEHAAAS